MEETNMNINQSGGFYGMEYGDLRVGGSMMALMTEQEQDQQNGESIMSVPLPLHPSSAFSCYNNNNGHIHGHGGHAEALLSAAAIFNGGVDHHHHSKHLVGGHFQSEQLVMSEQPPVFSDSSLSSVKLEMHSNNLELHRKTRATASSAAAAAAAGGGGGGRRLCWPEPSLVVRALSHYHHQQHQHQQQHQQSKESIVSSMEEESESPTYDNNNPKESMDAIKATIAAHPHYPRLLAAYMECHKSGASPEVVALLDEMIEGNLQGKRSTTMSIGADPELDQFMEAYCKMLGIHRVELSKTCKEAMVFINNMESQLNSLGITFPPGYLQEREEGGGSSEEELSCGEMEMNEVDPRAEDKELKDQLLRKYSGYFSSLKKEFLKKRKKGKLPKEARQKLLEWWELHNKWPYPSETDKVVLAENTGLDQKQINNWFINQRKRHWKAPEDMEQLIVMDGLHPQAASFYIDGLDS